MKVLLFADDLLRFPGAAAFRPWQLYASLTAAKIEVVLSLPASFETSDRTVAELIRYRWTEQSQDSIVRAVRPDAILFGGSWRHCHLRRSPNVPLVVDCFEPELLGPRQMWNVERKVAVLTRSDCLLASSKRMQIYLSGFWVGGGRVPEGEDQIRVVPFAVPDSEARRFREHEYPAVFCEIQGELDPVTARALAILGEKLATYGRGCAVLGGVSEKVFGQYRKRLLEHKRLAFFERERRHQELLSADLALFLDSETPRSALCGATWVTESLWAGTPVVVTPRHELAAAVASAGAGWVVPAQESSELKRTLREIFNDPTAIEERSAHAIALAAQCGAAQAIAPLLSFLQAPTRNGHPRPVVAAVQPRPGFLAARCPVLLEPVAVGVSEVRQRFILPGDEVTALHLPLTCVDAHAREQFQGIEILLTRAGRVLARHSLSSEEVPLTAGIVLKLPTFFRRPRGGDELELLCRLRGVSGGDPVVQQAVYSETVYPFCGKSHELALAIAMLPGAFTRAYRLRVLATRALAMVRRGEWIRIGRAVYWRSRQLGVTIRQKLQLA